jgi:hypothetical protein
MSLWATRRHSHSELPDETGAYPLPPFSSLLLSSPWAIIQALARTSLREASLLALRLARIRFPEPVLLVVRPSAPDVRAWRPERGLGLP